MTKEQRTFEFSDQSFVPPSMSISNRATTIQAPGSFQQWWQILRQRWEPGRKQKTVLRLLPMAGISTVRGRASWDMIGRLFWEKPFSFERAPYVAQRAGRPCFLGSMVRLTVVYVPRLNNRISSLQLEESGFDKLLAVSIVLWVRFFLWENIFRSSSM